MSDELKTKLIAILGDPNYGLRFQPTAESRAQAPYTIEGCLIGRQLEEVLQRVEQSFKEAGYSTKEERPKINNSMYVSLILDNKEYSTMTGIELLSNTGIKEAGSRLASLLVAELVEKQVLV